MLATRMSSRAALLCLIMLSGCQSNYAKYYQSYMDEGHSRSKHVAVQHYTPETLRSAQRNGAVLIGASCFTASYTDQKLAVQQAKRVGANLLLIDIRYRSSVSGTMTLPQYHAGQTVTSTTYNSGAGSAYGYGGSVHGNYRGTSTTYTQLPGYTTYRSVPYTIHYNDHTAYYLRDPHRVGLGLDE